MEKMLVFAMFLRFSVYLSFSVSAFISADHTGRIFVKLGIEEL
jgi:hypothetical protein